MNDRKELLCVYPPDCADGERCCECAKCFSLYVQEKWEGRLD